MAFDAIMILLVGATATTGLLAGASLDQSIKQLPARRRIGAVAFSRYSEAADLANGVLLYAVLGIGAAVLSVAAAATGRMVQVGGMGALALNAGGVLAIGHSLVTARAAPLNFSQRRVDNEAALSHVFDRFERLQLVHCVLQLANFGVNLWALILLSGRGT